MTIFKSILLTFLFILYLNLFGFWFYLVPENFSDKAITFLHLINSFIQLLIVLLYLRLIKRHELFKIKNVKSQYYIIALISGCLFVLLQPFLNIFYHLNLSIDLIPDAFNLSNLFSLDILTTIFIVPITEELFFRNYIQRDLQKNISYKKAIIVSSILFACIHLPFAAFVFDNWKFSIHHAYIAFFGSLISGWLFYKSKSIGPSIVFHMIWNLMACIS